MATGRPGPAALECAIDVWGKPRPVTPQPPLPLRRPSIDEDAHPQGREAPRRGEASADRLRRRRAGGVRRSHRSCRAMLQAPVLGYRRGRGVLDSRDPLSVTLPLGRELWGEADVVLGVGTRMLHPAPAMGHRRRPRDRPRRRRSARSPARLHKPAVALIGDAKPILRRLLDVLPAHNTQARLAQAEMEERQARMAQAPRQARAAALLPRRDPRRTAGGRHLRRRGDADRLCRPARVSGLQAAHVSLAGLSGQSRLGLCHRARRAGRAPRRAGAVDHRRRRLPVHGERDGDRGAPPHSADQRSCSATAPSATCGASRRRSSATG